MKPKILEFIENNTDSWEEKLNARLIRISRNGDLACFKYIWQKLISQIHWYVKQEES